jgi:hypothetical protein
MQKQIKKENVYYNIIWSQPAICDRHTIMGIPGMAGIVCIFQKKHDVINYLLFYASWKSGVRGGARDLLDPDRSQFPQLIELSENKNLMFKYTIIDTSPKDMQDIMYWLINEYSPELNNSEDFTDSQRYKEIYLLEMHENDEEEGSAFPKRTKK